MVFSSLVFLFIFLPLFLLVYYLVPARYRNWVMLLGSAAFYLYGTYKRPWVLLLFLGLNVITFFAGRHIEQKRRRHDRRVILTGSLLLIFASLIGFKYGGLFANATILLPLGLSFYSFQLAAYLIDVYRKHCRAEKSFFRFLTAMLLFPKLISGPLTPYDSISRQLCGRSYSWERFQYGMQDFLTGLALKTLLADQIGGLWHQVQTIGFASISTPLAWLGLASFSLQLYFDFFGYSLMAIGLGRMLGFRLPKNFVLPYTARSMTEFWRRWHITLGRWFLDYVYIPLGGSRAGKGKELRNLLIVWLLTGIWHGSTLNFLFWGLFVFVFIALEKLFLEKHLEKSRIISHVYFIIIIMLSWMLFAITDITQIPNYLARLFPFFGGEPIAMSDFLRLGQQYGIFIGLGVLASTSWFMRGWDRLRSSRWSTAILFVLFWLAIYYLSAGLNDPFLYFSF